MSLFRTLIAAVALLLGAHLQSQPLKLVLVDKIPLQQLAVEPLKWTATSDDRLLEDPAFGFLAGGKMVFFGRGGWVYDIESRKLEKRFPDTLYWPLPSADGRLMVATLQEKEKATTPWTSPWGGRLTWFDSNGETPVKPKWAPAAYPKHSALHPNNRILAVFDPKKRNLHYYTGIVFTDLQTGQTWKADDSKHGWGCELVEMFGFTGDGRFLLVLPSTSGVIYLLDTQTFRLLPAHEEDGYVFNRDANWVAGGYRAGSTFVWDRIKKIFVWENRPIWDPEKVNHVWKNKPYGIPYAFSPNGKYLLCEGVVVSATTGDPVFRNLNGKQGKFSPDGRSLVTVDDEAFYVYTLPKESEPIFGVFQKPDPWSPPGSKKPVKTPSKKPIKKP